MLATISAPDFAYLASSCGGFFTLALVSIALLLPALFLGFCAAEGRMMVRYDVAPVGVYRLARDGRAFVQVGRVCHFGRKGESEMSLRARLAGVL